MTAEHTPDVIRLGLTTAAGHIQQGDFRKALCTVMQAFGLVDHLHTRTSVRRNYVTTVKTYGEPFPPGNAAYEVCTLPGGDILVRSCQTGTYFRLPVERLALMAVASDIDNPELAAELDKQARDAR